MLAVTGRRADRLCELRAGRPQKQLETIAAISPKALADKKNPAEAGFKSKGGNAHD